jgi:hypothetical protein
MQSNQPRTNQLPTNRNHVELEDNFHVWRAFQYFVKLVFSTTLICSCVGHLKRLVIDVQRWFYHCRCAAVDKLGCEKAEIKRGLQSFLTHAEEGVGDKSTQELVGISILWH